MIRKVRTEQDYLALITSIGDWFWEMDSNFVYSYSSQAIETILGYSPEEIVGLTPYDLVSRDEVERVSQRCAEIRDKKEPFRFLIKANHRADGRAVILETNGCPFYDDDGKIAGYRGIDRDVTESNGERQLGDYYRKLLETVKNPAVITTADGTIVYINNAFTTLMGYTFSEISGHNISILNAPETEFDQSTDLTLEKLLGADAVKSIRKRKRKNGELVTVAISAKSTEEHDLDAAFRCISYQDLSAVLSLQDSIDELESVRLFSKTVFLDNLLPVFWFKLPKPLALSLSRERQLKAIIEGAYIHDLSESFAQIFERSKCKLLGLNFGTIVKLRGSDAQHAFTGAMKALVDGEYSKTTENFGPLHMPNGNKVWVSITIKALVNNGFVMDLIGSMTDITERHLSHDLLRKNERLLERSQSIAKVGGWELDILSNELYWTEETYRIHETAPSEFNPTVDAGVELYLPESQKKLSNALDAALKLGQAYDLELEAYTTKGNLITVRTTCDATLEDGKPIKLTGIFQDITEHKATERYLRQLVVEKELALSSANLGSWEFDVETGVIELSEIERKFFDLSEGESFPNLEEFYKRVHPDDVALVHTLLHKVRQGRNVEDAKYRVIKPNGEFRFIHGSAVSFNYKFGINSTPVVRIIGIDRDITEEIETQDELLSYAKRLKRSLDGTVTMAMELGELRDPYTTGHEARVAQISVQIARVLGLDDSVVQTLDLAGKLHDIGKFIAPVEILSKPGRLTKPEFELVKGHAQASYDILKGVDFPWPVAEIAYQHHERLDGSGYPRGLKGDEILFEARILAVADVVEAMSSHRPYRPALGIDQALAELQRGRDSIYDAIVVDACIKLFREMNFKLIEKAYNDHQS